MNLQVHQNYRGALTPSRSLQGIFLNLAPDINELLSTDYFHFLQAVTDSNGRSWMRREGDVENGRNSRNSAAGAAIRGPEGDMPARQGLAQHILRGHQEVGSSGLYYNFSIRRSKFLHPFRR